MRCLAALLICWLVLYACPEALAKLLLIPQPQQVEELPGEFALSRDARIRILPGGDPDLRFAADLTAEELRLRRADEGEIVVGLPAASREFAALCEEAGCLPDEALGEQGYVLLVTPERILIAANAPAGAFYGVQTLLQLAEIGSGRRVPCVRIRDWPVLRWRGVLTDQSRQAVPKVETYKRMIRELSRCKINFVSMHLEHTFVVEKHPVISEGTGALTAAEAREICDYARKYHCLFFPSFEAFGHQHHILKHPEYADLAESDWKYSFAPTVEGTYSLLADIFDEMCPAFTGTDFLNAGSDEVGDLGTGKSKELADRIGKAALYAQHMNRVHDLLAARGKRMMMWGDMLLQHPEAMDLIPRDTIIMDWHYGPQHDYPSITQFRDKAFDVFVVPALSSWVRLFPDYETALENIEWLIRRGREGGAIGSMTCNWGDDGNENLIANCYYGWLFAAECSWGAEPERIDRDLFDRAFCRQFFGTRSREPAKAVHLLSTLNFALSREPYFNQRFYHEDPFKGPTRRSWPSGFPALEMGSDARVQRDALGAPGLVSRNADVIDAMRFAALRLWFVGCKAETFQETIDSYGRLWYGPDRAHEAEEETLTRLMALREGLAEQRAAFVEQWNRDNRPEGIEYALGKFDAQLAAFDAHIAALQDAKVKGVVLPPREVDLDDRRLTRWITPEIEDFGSASAEWTGPGPGFRIPMRISAGGHDRVSSPLLLRIPWEPMVRRFGDVLKVDDDAKQEAAPAEPARIDWRVFVNGDLVPAQDAKPDELADTLVAFILPGTLKAGSTITADLYACAVQQAPEPAEGITVTQADDPVLIRNTGYEALVGREGAHVFTWKLAKLGGLDITQPGESAWAGWFDDPRTRNSDLRLWVESAAEPLARPLESSGPVVAIVQALGNSDPDRTLYFWTGLPYAECLLGDPTGMSWAFDSTANFAADAPMPGTAYLSNGFSAPVPASTEQRQVPEGGARAWWCCKTRADGLTLGLITPAEQTNMKVGPGGGWGGVGIEGSNQCQYFVVYCDVDPRGPAAVEEVYHTLARDDPVTVTFGKPEVRP